MAFSRLHGGRCYKLLVATLLAFLIVEFSFNLLVFYQEGFRSFMRFGTLPGLFKGISGSRSNNNRNKKIVSGVSFVDKGPGLEGNQSTRKPEEMRNPSPKPLELCPLLPRNLVGHLKVHQQAPPFKEMEKMFSYLEPGGRFKPKNCTARHRVAIIIPYRDREVHLGVFLYNMHQMLPRQQIDYGIFVIEQEGEGKFNRAKLFNIGYLEALESYDYQCFIFHDVDLIPEDDRNLYTCPDDPRHMSVAINTLNYKLPYAQIFGGVSALKKEHMQLVNGFSNMFWGWGGEDDDMSRRLKHHHLKISRYPASIAKYTMLCHPREVPSSEGSWLFYKGILRYRSDGINSVKYNRKEIVYKKLYTWVSADLKGDEQLL